MFDPDYDLKQKRCREEYKALLYEESRQRYQELKLQNDIIIDIRTLLEEPQEEVIKDIWRLFDETY